MNIKRFAATLTLLATLTVSPEMAYSQVFGSGPSDPALFTTVINLPPDPNIGFNEFASGGTQLNVADGGHVGSLFHANSGSEVNISGGTVGFAFGASSGSEVNISGGFVDGRFTANIGSQVSFSGGVVGGAFRAAPGSVVELFGGEFQLNGEAFTGTAITLAEDEVFTGTLADGSSFIFASQELEFVSDGLGGDSLSGGRLIAAPLPAFDTTPVVIDSPVTERLTGLRSGQTLTLVDSGSLRGSFAVVDATLNVQGGILGSGVKTAGSVVNIRGGTVGSRFQAYFGSEVNISGGVVGDGPFEGFGLALGASSGSVVNISGGLVTGLEAASGSVVNITGGTVDTGIFFATSVAGLVAESGSEVNISGGTVVGIGFIADDGSAVNISGTQFLLNGELLDDLVVGESFTITEPIETLTGILADGSPFSFGQGEFGNPANFSPGATVTVTLSSILGDVSGDGVVNFLDIAPFIAVLANGDFQFEADTNEDGVVNFLDIQSFIAILSGQ